MKVLQVLKVLLVIVFFGLLIYFAFLLVNDINPNLFGGNSNNQPTPNLTAVAEWTPTPNSPDQAANVVATAWPTPVTRIMPADREAFRQALLGKLTAESINWSLLSNINHAGVAWRCSDLKLGDLSLPGSTSGTMVAVWSSWYGGVDNKTMTINVEDGSQNPGIKNKAENTIDIYKNAKVTITFPDFGIVGPEIQQGNEIALMVDKPSIIYGVWLTPREWITGEDLIGQKQNDNTNFALDWAKVDSIAPLNKDGSRDQVYLDLLYNMAAGSLNPDQVSVDLPNGGSVNLDHSLYQTLMTIANEAAQKAGYAGVESLTISIAKPGNLSGYHYLSNHDVPVVPADIAAEMANSTCPQVKLVAEALNSLQNTGLPNDAVEGILKRLLEITKE